MKILMILERDFPDDDRVKKEALSLIKAGHSVDLLCYSMKGSDRIEKLNGINIFKKRITTFIYKSGALALSFPAYFKYWHRILSEHLKTYSYDVIHLHDLPLARVVYNLSEKHNTKFVLDLHENYPALLQMSDFTKKFPVSIFHSQKKWENYERYYVSKADGIITVVKEMKERILPLTPSNVAVVENTPYINELIVYDEPVDNQFITIIYSGGITYHRGLQYVIRGLKLALEEDDRIRLTILGSGSYQKTLRELVDKLGISEYVVFKGMVSHDMMFRIIAQSDIALIPHIKSVQSDNSSPNKLFEYMYCGKPILASNCISVERVLAETKTGLVYVHDSADDFKNKLLQLISYKPFDQFKSNGIRAVTEKYNWERSCNELLELYSKFESGN